MTEVVLYLISLVSAFFAGVVALRTTIKKFPYFTVSLCVLLAICLLAQLYIPSLLTAFERNTAAVQSGAWWRLFTALFFQDGGLFGGMSNIAFLALLGSIAEQLFKKKLWVGVYFMSGFTAECVALVWQPIGAGNSVAYFGLAGAIVGSVLLSRTDRLSTSLGIISGVCSLLMLFMQDMHGFAFLAGVLLSFLMKMLPKDRHAENAA